MKHFVYEVSMFCFISHVFAI